VDEADSDPVWEDLGGLTADGAEELMGNAAPPHFPARAFLVAAVREAFEETAVLLGAGSNLDPDWAQAARTRVHTGGASFAGVLVEQNLTVDLSSLLFFSRWITPAVMPRRYDTCFFASAIPTGQEPLAAPGEIESIEWIAPQAALERAGSTSNTMPPTRAALRTLAGHASAADAVAALRDQRNLAPVLPRVIMEEGQATRILMPGDPGYDD
jgi:8-oxo-dGTP pyrophosphatase MutT (NUDIX family)